MKTGDKLYNGRKSVTIGKVGRKHVYDTEGDKIDMDKWSTKKPRRKWVTR